jgi:hypothetical protein
LTRHFFEKKERGESKKEEQNTPLLLLLFATHEEKGLILLCCILKLEADAKIIRRHTANKYTCCKRPIRLKENFPCQNYENYAKG